jgi:hypothetical protein
MAKTRRHGDNPNPLAKTRRHGDNRHPLSFTRGPGYGELAKTIRPK